MLTSFETSGHVQLPATQHNYPEDRNSQHQRRGSSAELSNFLTISHSKFGIVNLKRVRATCFPQLGWHLHQQRARPVLKTQQTFRPALHSYCKLTTETLNSSPLYPHNVSAWFFVVFAEQTFS
jgi:hypothetical protein